ncbi:MAG: hypothetical protein FVQ77_01410 [Cytophagales bacterium]|nr:hypothetical protein [Cytophagales bacterium]
MEGFYLISIWLIQIVLFTLMVLDKVKWKIKRREIFYIAFVLFLIAPWIFPVQVGYNSETGEYICGLASLIPIGIFWILGNGVNIVILLLFWGIGFLIKKSLWKLNLKKSTKRKNASKR